MALGHAQTICDDGPSHDKRKQKTTPHRCAWVGLCFLDFVVGPRSRPSGVGIPCTVVATDIATNFQLRAIIGRSCRIAAKRDWSFAALESASTSASSFVYLGYCFCREFGNGDVRS